MTTTAQALSNSGTQALPNARQYEITTEYLRQLDKHLLDIVNGHSTEMFEIRDIAQAMHIHPTHLSNTIKQTTGNHPCFYFEEKILAIAKSMLEENKLSISAIAQQLTYDPSNFTKFFKKFAGQTPKQYREAYLEKQRHPEVLTKKTETVTINSQANLPNFAR